MKVLLCFPQQDLQTGLYIREGLEELGIEVCVFDPRAMRPIQAGAALMCEVWDAKPDWVLSSREAYLAPVVKEIRATCPFVVWSMDVRKDMSWWKPWLPLFQDADALFTMAKADVERYKELGMERVFWLPEGCAPAHHRVINPESLSPQDREYYASDVSFCGGVDGFHDTSELESGRRSAILEALGRRFKLKVWGAGLALPYVQNEEHNKVVACSKVHLGCSAFPEIEGSMSARDYRALGSGGFLVTNRVKGIEEVLSPRWTRTYGSATECLDQVAAVIEEWECNPAGMTAARQEISLYAAENHSFARRLSRMVEVLRNERIAPG